MPSNENEKKIRCRKWFITINPKAECYSKTKEIVEHYKYTHYAMIYHDADEDNENNKHIHIVIEFKNAQTFEGLKAKFNGADLEQIKFIYQAYKYLIHLESDNKRKYSIDQVITDNINYYQECIKCNEYEKLDTKAIMDDITNGVNTITEFVRKYGLYQVSRLGNVLTTLIRENQYIERINDLEYKIKELKAEKEELEERNKELEKNLDEKLPW